MAALRVRTGVAQRGNRWYVIVKFGDLPTDYAQPGFDTEAEAEACATTVAARLREKYRVEAI